MPARPSARPSASPSAPPPAALDAFRHALYPILRARDAAAFRRLLADSEDLLGDTGELTDWPEARVRALMADLLREPARFGLPRWPAPGAEPGAASTASGDPTPPATATLPTLGGDAETASTGSNPARAHAGTGDRRASADAAPAHEIGGPEPTAGAASGGEARAPASGVKARARGPRVEARAPAPGAATDAEPPAADSSPPAAAGEPSEAAEAPREAPPKPRPSRRPARRVPPEQLSLW